MSDDVLSDLPSFTLRRSEFDPQPFRDKFRAKVSGGKGEGAGPRGHRFTADGVTYEVEGYGQPWRTGSGSYGWTRYVYLRVVENETEATE